MSDPLVSIALCTCNGARYLADQLDSLLAQTHQNIEIVAVDDCSSDATVTVLNEYAQRDARLRVSVNCSNVGYKRNFEIAMLQCRGDYIAPCDQDDVWLPEKLQTLLVAISDRPLAYCNSELTNETGAPLGAKVSDQFNLFSTDDPAVFAVTNCVSGHAMLFRRELLQRALPVPEGFFHDWWLAAVAASTGGVVYADQVLVRYRQHTAAVTYSLKADRSPEQRKPPGFRIRDLQDIGQRLDSLAMLPGSHQAFLKKLCHLWRARESQWLSIALAWFLVLHSGRLYAMTEKSRLKLARRAIKFMWGLRLKRLTNKYAYVG